MPSKLRWKWIVIVCVLIGSLAGVFGLPASRREALDNLKKNVRLGLDLSGGSHIVLQVQIQDAFKAEADSAMDELREALVKQRFEYTSMERSEPASPETAAGIQITVEGIPADRAAEFRRIAADALGTDWVFLPGGGTGQELGMRPEAAARLRQDTVSQSMSVIERRVNGLGVAETSVQQRGGTQGNEILVSSRGWKIRIV